MGTGSKDDDRADFEVWGMSEIDRSVAFPLQGGCDANPYPEFGMELRDYFAAKAMQGMVAADCGWSSTKDYADFAYEMADAMMSARK